MRKILLAGAAALTVAISPAHAAEILYETGRYDATIGNGAVGVSLNTCPDFCFGGYTFPAPGLPPTRVVVKDASGTPVGVVVAQSTDGDQFSGEPGEPRVTGCGGSLDLSKSVVAFEPGLPIAVFVRALDPVQASAPGYGGFGCAGIGTQGSIELYVDDLTDAA